MSHSDNFTNGDEFYNEPLLLNNFRNEPNPSEESLEIKRSAIDFFVLPETLEAANVQKNETTKTVHPFIAANQPSVSFSSPVKIETNLQYRPTATDEYIPQRIATFGGREEEDEEEDLSKSKTKTIPYVPKPFFRNKNETDVIKYVPKNKVTNTCVDDTDTPFAPYVPESVVVEKSKSQKTQRQTSNEPKAVSKPVSTEKQSTSAPIGPSVLPEINSPEKDLSSLTKSGATKRPSTTESDEVPGVKSARVAHKPSYDASLVPKVPSRPKRPTRSSLRQLMADRYKKVAEETAAAAATVASAPTSSSTNDQIDSVKEKTVQLNTSPNKKKLRSAANDTSTTNASPILVSTSTTNSSSPNTSTAPTCDNSRYSKPAISVKPSTRIATTLTTPNLGAVNRISTEPSASKSIAVGTKSNLRINSPSTVLVAKGKPAEVVTSKAAVSRFTVGKREKSSARVAHVPKPISVKDATRLGINPDNLINFSGSGSSKGSSEAAHRATLSKLLMPLADASARIPLSVRRSTLLKIRAELISGTGLPAEALSPDQLELKSAEAQQLEKEIAGRAKNNRNIYVSLGASKVATIRRELKEAKGDTALSDSGSSSPALSTRKLASKKFRQLLSTAPTTPAAKISHDALLMSSAKNCSLVVRGSARVADLTREELVYQLGKLIIPSEELEKYNFPRPVTGDEENDEDAEVAGKAFLPNVASAKAKLVPYKEGMSMTCRRCRAIYRNPQKIAAPSSSDPNANAVCVYHEGRVFKFRDRQGVEGKYTCCKGERDSRGCALATAHVTDGLEFIDAHQGFFSTVPGGLSGEVAPNVFALDCEMCYTDRNLALSRVTLLNFEGNVVYDALVKPEGVILDYNTKFSGIKEGDLEGVTTTLADVQREIRSLVAAESILIGHGLDSDFRVLKLFHEKVVDTTYLYPHRQGLPYKRSLRMLASNFLNRIIQDSEEGHDSSEDAKAALELVKLKLQEELNKFLINGK